MISFLFLLGSITWNISHTGQLAEYHLTLKDEQLHMKVVLEKDEIINYNYNTDCNFSKMTALCTANYIGLNLSIEINEEKVRMELDNSYTERGHLILLFRTKLSTTDVKTIKIKNRCFYEFDPDYKNRIIMHVSKFRKSYLLTKDKDLLYLN